VISVCACFPKRKWTESKSFMGQDLKFEPTGGEKKVWGDL
jgi:hypothetical protein